MQTCQNSYANYSFLWSLTPLGQVLDMQLPAVCSLRSFLSLEPPWPPQVLAAGDVTSTSACLWWTVGFDGGAPQTFLLMRKVDINDGDDEKCEMAVVPDKEEQRVERCVQGLTPGTNYTFLLIATNRYGVCSSTVILNISTPSQSLYTTACVNITIFVQP